MALFISTFDKIYLGHMFSFSRDRRHTDDQMLFPKKIKLSRDWGEK